MRMPAEYLPVLQDQAKRSPKPMHMNIVLTIDSLAAGGAQRVMVHLANHWAAEGHRVTIATLAGTAHDAYQLHPRVRRVVLGHAGDSRHAWRAVQANVQRLHALRRVLRRIRPDAALAFMPTMSVLTILAGRGIVPRVVVSERIHPPMLPLNWYWDRLRRLAYPLAWRVVMQTRQGLEWLQAAVPAARGSVIPNPVLWPLPCTDPVLAPERIVPDRRRLMLAVGRLDRQKGFDVALQAFAQASRQHPEWCLVILGEGPERSALEAQRADLGCADRVFLPGRVGNVGDWYQRAGIFVLSSHFEGFPNVLIEAMASGCAVIAADCPTGPRDIITHGHDGWLVPVGDAEALASAMQAFMADAALRQRLAAQAISVRQRYALRTVAGMWEAVVRM